MNDGIERLVELAATDYRGLIGRRLKLLAVHAAAGVFAMLCVASLAGAAAIALADRFGAVTALAMVAAAMGLIALGLVLTAITMKRSHERVEESMRLNRQMAMVGALSLLAGRSSRRPAMLFAVIGALLALRRVLFGRN